MDTTHFLNIVFIKAVLNLKSESSRTYLSYFWWVLEPCLYMGIFYVVFGILLNSKTENYVAFLLTGLIPWLWISKSILNSSQAITAGKNLMLQMHIPKIFFPSVVIMQDFLKQIVVVFILLLALLVIGTPVTPYWLLLFILIPLQLFFISGISLLGSFITPFIPDFSLILTTGLMLLMFGSGIFYEIDQINAEYHTYFFLNPTAALIQSYRDILVYARMPSLGSMVYIFLFSSILLTVSIFLLKSFDQKFPRIVSER